jgi:hypothetical protein
MRLQILKLSLVFALLMTFSLTASAAKSEKDDRPTKKTAVIKQQTTPTSKPAPTIIEETLKTTPITPSTSAPLVGEQINWQVLASGGGVSTMGSLTLGSTIGQTVTGQSSMGSLTLNSGYQQNFVSGGSGPCCIGPMRGDINYDDGELIDISDLMYLIDYMFLAGPAPVCFEEADINASGTTPLDISDLVWLIDYMFLGGPEPTPCP